MTNIKSPPVFKPDEDDDYVSWKNDVSIWKLFTDVKAEKIGAAVYLALQGKAREVVRSLKPEEIGSPGGYDLIIRTLDAVYLKDDSTRAYCAFKDFYEYRRSAGDDFSDFIVEYEQRYNKLIQFKMELPEGVQAFFLLKAANMTEDSERLARATANLDYKDMKDKVMKIFGDPGLKGDTGGVPIVKEEVLYGHGYRGSSNSGSRGGYRRTYNRGGRGSGRNPSSSYNGRIFRCHICESTKHFAKECPHKEDHEQVNMNVHLTLLSSKPDSVQKSLVLESLGKGLLDSGCSKTVAGTVWLNEYINTLSAEELKGVRESPSKSLFRFGDGVEARSIKKVTLPIVVGPNKMKIDVEVVNNDIPLLLSKGAMKQMSITLDFAKDTVTLSNGKAIKLMCTSTGHYCLPLSHTLLDVNNVNIVLHMSALENLSISEKKKKALKLHKQFSHASKERLLKLIKTSSNKDREFQKCIEQVCDECEVCQKYKKPPLHPIVSLPLAEKFNEVVAMDLKEFQHGKIWIFHMIDTATKYSAATLIKTKKKEVIVAQIFKMWISYFGCPKRFFSDNGGEFANEVMKEMNEKLGVETVTTAAESPFSNGICERHNAILFESMSKTLEDSKCEPELALAWAVSAKNALQNKNGFSPNQLVFGHNVNLPTVLTDLPPALESTTSSDIIRQNLNAMHNARTNYIKAESSEKIRRALRHKTRTFSNQIFSVGEKVFYKRKNLKGWRGPAIVTGTDAKVILVRHGSTYYRCHPCHLLKIKNPEKVADSQNRRKKSEGMKENGKIRIEDEHTDSEEEQVDSDPDKEGKEETEESEEEKREVEEEDDELEEESKSEEAEECQEKEMEQVGEKDDRGMPEDRDIGQEKEMEKVGERKDNFQDKDGLSQQVKKPKALMYIRYKLNNGHSYTARILSKQPKRRGKNGDWINVKVDGDEHPISVNWNEVTEWKHLPDQEKVVLFAADDEMSQEVVDAKEREIQNLRDNDVYEAVQFKNQPLVSCKWVITEKVKDEKKVVKARLVARGFEESIHNARTDSPTCSRQSLRIVFATASSTKWDLQSLDITSAFLQGKGIEREVFLKPPPEVYEEGVVWKLKRCIYGLKDAPRAWYERVENELQSLGGKRSIFDEALFLWFDDNSNLVGILVSHVDDFVYCGTDKWHQRVIDALMMKFKISAHFKGSFKYIGLNVVQGRSSIQVDQQKYVESLKEINLSSERLNQKDDKLTDEEKTLLRSVSGQLLWASTQTRPDISFDACVISNYGKEPTIRNILAANKSIKKLKSTTSKILFPELGKFEEIKVLVYSDATHASLPTGASQGALIVFLAGNGNVAPIMWQSKKLNRVTKSPLASETMELAEAADAGFLIASMIQEAYNLQYLPPIECFTDSYSLTEFLKTSHVIQDTRLRVDVARIREMLKLNEIKVTWVKNELQLADSLTKAGASSIKLLDVLRNGKLNIN